MPGSKDRDIKKYMKLRCSANEPCFQIKTPLCLKKQIFDQCALSVMKFDVKI